MKAQKTTREQADTKKSANSKQLLNDIVAENSQNPQLEVPSSYGPKKFQFCQGFASRGLENSDSRDYGLQRTVH